MSVRTPTAVPGRPPALLGSYARALLPKRSAAAPLRLPERCAVLTGVPIDPGHLRRYARTCGFATGPAASAGAPGPQLPPLPLTYPHLVGFPLQLGLMARRDFPFPLLGLVHIANEIERTRPLTPGEPLSYTVHAEQPYGHPRGTAFTMAVDAAAPDGETVWRSRSTYLTRHRTGTPGGSGSAGPEAPGEAGEPAGAGGVPGRDPGADPGADPGTGPELSEVWQVPGSTGREYARVSGDRNPIHLHRLPARLLGFPRAIAHGMWSKARCLAALSDRLPAGACRVRVTFHAPVLLPSEVRFRAAGSPDGPGLSFTLTTPDGARTHLRGEVAARPGGR
ncbi:MaoC family dehydratase [Streptomyces sp. YIM 98790]|uniref:MaoC family dehydratase n=1 Tax=Streptomyces sp. YIM 98790 TaxID=2689077 RepID=UPI00140901C9|nr:MaoC/PaaZ C-terminal domain-containing protein [Streptomyces sp. YIM 98790]